MEREVATNHWGDTYNTVCVNCNEPTSWECLEELPEGYTKPPAWTDVMLIDLLDNKS